MAQPSNRPFYVTVSVVALGILVVLGLLVANLVTHALHHTTATPVTAMVTDVQALSPSSVRVTATVRSRASIPAQVSCLVGIERPGMPLAFPTRITEQLAPGQTKTVVVTRSLIKPAAAQVRLSDVAFTCT